MARWDELRLHFRRALAGVESLAQSCLLLLVEVVGEMAQTALRPGTAVGENDAPVASVAVLHGGNVTLRAACRHLDPAVTARAAPRRLASGCGRLSMPVMVESPNDPALTNPLGVRLVPWVVLGSRVATLTQASGDQVKAPSSVGLMAGHALSPDLRQVGAVGELFVGPAWRRPGACGKSGAASQKGQPNNRGSLEAMGRRNFDHGSLPRPPQWYPAHPQPSRATSPNSKRDLARRSRYHRSP